MRGRLLAVAAALGAVLGVLLGAVAVAGAASAEPAPEVRLDASRIGEGGALQVSGTGWPVGDFVGIRLCATSDGAPVCADGGVEDVAVTWDGSFTQTLVVRRPPTSCPCEVVVLGDSGATASTPVALEGRARGRRATPALVIEEVAVERDDSLASLFGAPVEATVVVLLRNAGAAPAVPELDLVWRDGSREPVAVDAPELAPLPAGESLTARVPVRFDSFTQGAQALEGAVVADGLVVPVKASTTVVPWGLYGVLLILLALAGAARLLISPREPREPLAPPARPAPPRVVDVETRAHDAISLTTLLAAVAATVWVPRQRSPLSSRLAARAGVADPGRDDTAGAR